MEIFFSVQRKRLPDSSYHGVLYFQASYNPGTNCGLVGTCLGIKSTAPYGSEDSWLDDDMIKALILDAIGAGNILIWASTRVNLFQGIRPNHTKTSLLGYRDYM